MKLSRISLILVLLFMSGLVLATSVNAYTNAELSNYLTETHLIGGYQYRLSDANCAIVKDYLINNPVTDAQATKIKQYLDEAITKANEAITKANSVVSLANLSDAQKAEIISLLQKAGVEAGISVSVNTNNKTITISKDGTLLLSGSYVADGNGGITVKFSAGSLVSAGSTSTVIPGTASNGGAKTFVYTGASNTLFVVIALLAVVAVSTVVIKRVYAK